MGIGMDSDKPLQSASFTREMSGFGNSAGDEERHGVRILSLATDVALVPSKHRAY